MYVKTKKVNIYPQMPVRNVNPVISSAIRGVTKSVEDIRKCILARAIVEEIVDGKPVRLDLNNYNLDLSSGESKPVVADPTPVPVADNTPIKVEEPKHEEVAEPIIEEPVVEDSSEDDKEEVEPAGMEAPTEEDDNTDDFEFTEIVEDESSNKKKYDGFANKKRKR